MSSLPDANIKTCSKCGGSEWGAESRCKICRRRRMRDYRKRNAAAIAERRRLRYVNQTPCSSCGARERGKGGQCKPCQREGMNRFGKTLQEIPCEQCGQIDRYANGGCRPCTRRRVTESARARAHCTQCGGHDLTPSGRCRACDKRRYQNRERCSRCGSRNLYPGGQCKDCEWASRRQVVECPTCGSRDLTASNRCRPCMRRVTRQWAIRNPTANRVNKARRRARERGAAGTYTKEELQQRYAAQQGRCHWCHQKLGKHARTWHADHVIPLAEGGSNDIGNIVVSCASCNYSKGARMPWEFAGRLF